MQSKLLNSDKEQTYVVIFDEGDEFTEGMLAFAKEHNLTAAHFTAIGAFKDAKLGWFNPGTKEYEENAIDEQVEVLSLVGNVAEHEGKPESPCPCRPGQAERHACGGHILEAHVRPTLEVTVMESPTHLHRIHDEKTGLPLIRPNRTRPAAALRPPRQRRRRSGIAPFL